MKILKARLTYSKTTSASPAKKGWLSKCQRRCKRANYSTKVKENHFVKNCFRTHTMSKSMSWWKSFGFCTCQVSIGYKNKIKSVNTTKRATTFMETIIEILVPLKG